MRVKQGHCFAGMRTAATSPKGAGHHAVVVRSATTDEPKARNAAEPPTARWVEWMMREAGAAA